MGQPHKKSSKRKVEEEKPDLERFAGSSEEEAEPESSDDESDVKETRTKEPADNSQASSENEEKETKNTPEDSDESNSSDDDDDEKDLQASGMAHAMSRILGTTAKAGTSAVILSKTTTPLQRMALKEKELAKEQREKRRANRERNLTALHVPLTVATTSTSVQSTNSGSVAKELEAERTHRRVATRGVVALFNAIAQHQKKQEEQVPSVSTSSSKQEVKKLSKHGFLDMIKTAAATKTEEKEPAQESSPSKPASKWSALQDDYMLNSKLKDWDKESSEDEEVGETAEDGNWSEEENSPIKQEAQPSQKKRRVGAR